MTLKYIAMAMHRWDDCRLEGLPCDRFSGMFSGMNNGSIGFMAIFDDMAKLEAAYPGGVDIIKIEKDGDYDD